MEGERNGVEDKCARSAPAVNGAQTRDLPLSYNKAKILIVPKPHYTCYIDCLEHKLVQYMLPSSDKRPDLK